MNVPDTVEYFDEDGMSDSDRISVYKELLRVIEKDVDEIDSKDSREGWTMAGIVGVIIAGALAFIGQTKELDRVPPQTALVGVSFLLLIYSLWFLVKAVLSDTSLVKEGRMISPRDAYRGTIGSGIVRTVILLGVSYFVINSDMTIGKKIGVILPIFLPAIYFVLVVFTFGSKDYPFGNNPKFKKVKVAWGIFFLLCFLVPGLLVAGELSFPIGKELSAAYVLGVSLGLIVALLELLLSKSSKSTLAGDLRDLRDDIIFQRLNLNESTNKYKVLREGKSLFDEMKEDYDGLMSQLFFQEELFDQLVALIDEMNTNMEMPTDEPEVARQKKINVERLRKSLILHRKELDSSLTLTGPMIKNFHERMGRVANATGDYNAQSTLSSLLQIRLSNVAQKEAHLNSITR